MIPAPVLSLLDRCADRSWRCLDADWPEWPDCVEEPFLWAEGAGMTSPSKRYAKAMRAFMAPCSDAGRVCQ